MNVFELKFYQDRNIWGHIEISENELDRVIDLLNYKNHYVLSKKLHIPLGNHNCIYVCRRGLKFFTSQNVLIKHKQQCGEQDITSMRLSNESYMY